MKRFQTIFLSYLALLSPQVLGKTPMMAREVLKASTAPMEASHCNQAASLDEVNSYKESFNANISCAITCTGKEKVSRTTQKRFSPTDHGLFSGDGSSNEKTIWRSLGITLNTWSKVNCLELASKECGKLEKISDVEVSEVSSGTWSYKGDLDCSSKDLVLSPFDHAQKLAGYQRTNDNILFSDYLTPLFKEESSTLYAHNLNKKEANDLIYYNKSDCKHPIKIYACFGDCVWSEPGQKQWTETLATPEFLGSDNFNICADNYIKNIAHTSHSKAVKQIKCEQFVWEVIRKSNSTGESCAALRLEADCSQL